MNPDKNIPAFLLCILLHISIFAQQPVSPLVASFETHRKMKSETPFKLDWISLGPTVNSARVEAVQLDPEHRAPSMWHLDPAIYGSRSIMEYPGIPYLKISHPWG